MSVIFGTSGQGKQLARTTPIQVTGLKALGENGGVSLSIDPPSEASYAYLKDYWVTFKKASQGAILHPYDGEHMVFPKGQAPAANQKLSELGVEGKVKIPLENGAFMKWKIVGIGAEGMPSGAVTAWYDDVAFSRNINSPVIKTYESSQLRTYLNGEFYNQFSASAKECIVPTPYSSYAISQMKILTDNVYIFSTKELGLSGDEGVALPYFSSNTQRAYTLRYWTREHYPTSAGYFYTVEANGQTLTPRDTTGVDAIRPVMNLNPDAPVSFEADESGYYTLLV